MQKRDNDSSSAGIMENLAHELARVRQFIQWYFAVSAFARFSIITAEVSIEFGTNIFKILSGFSKTTVFAVQPSENLTLAAF